MRRLSIAVILLFLAACDAVAPQATPTPSARIASANAQATAIVASAINADSADASNAAWTATERAQRANASAATQATLDAGYVAEQNARVAAAQAEAERARNSMVSQATIDAANAISTSHTITVSAQVQEVSAQATATAIVKQIANGVTANDADTWINIISGLIVKIGIPALIIIASLIALRKWQQRDLIQQPHKDGPAFVVDHYLLCAPNARVIWNPHDDPRYLIAAPVQSASQSEQAPSSSPIADNEIKIMFMAQKYLDASINYERYLTTLGELHNDKHHHGWDGHQLLTARECAKIKLFGRNDDWQTVADWLVTDKHIAYSGQGNTGIYSWDTLGAAALALAQIVSPYSAREQIIDQNEAGTPGEQGTAGTAGNTREHAGTGQDRVPILDSAVRNLPRREVKA